MRTLTSLSGGPFPPKNLPPEEGKNPSKAERTGGENHRKEVVYRERPKDSKGNAVKTLQFIVTQGGRSRRGPMEDALYSRRSSKRDGAMKEESVAMAKKQSVFLGSGQYLEGP